MTADNFRLGSGQVRLWRLRKRNHHVDADVTRAGSHEVELRFSYDGRTMLVRRCRTNRSARARATEKRKELELAGWTEHW